MGVKSERVRSEELQRPGFARPAVVGDFVNFDLVPRGLCKPSLEKVARLGFARAAREAATERAEGLEVGPEFGVIDVDTHFLVAWQKKEGDRPVAPTSPIRFANFSCFAAILFS